MTNFLSMLLGLVVCRFDPSSRRSPQVAQRIAGEPSPFTIPVARAVAYERKSGSGKAHGALALPPRIWLRRIRATPLEDSRVAQAVVMSAGSSKA